MALRHLVRSRQRAARARSLTLSDFSLGLNTAAPASEISLHELAELVNLKLAAGGKLEKRPGIQRYSTAAVTGNAKIIAAGDGIIGGNRYEFAIDENHRLYYLDGNRAPVFIGTVGAAAAPQIMGFNGVVLILDGSYIKYLDSLSAVKILYDDGSGPAGYQFDNRAGTDDTTIALGNGTNTRVAARFTSASWDAGFTVPPTSVSVKLSKTGTPSASAVTARLRKASDDAVIATATLLSDATALTGTAEAYTADFTVSAEMTPAAAYYLSIEHAGGDAANHVNVHCTTVASGGKGYHYAGAWSADPTAEPIMALKPGLAPKANFGTVWGYRAWVVSPDAPGKPHFSAYGHKDWSTPGLAGAVGAIDEDENNYPVGAIADMFGNLMIYGTKDSPYLCRLTGTGPSDFAFNPFFQRVWSTQRLLQSVIGDLWSVSEDGVAALSGVQEYGDLRSHPVSDAVGNLVAGIDTDSAFAGYYPADGQFWLVQPDYHRVLVAAVSLPTLDRRSQRPRYPWMQYEFYRDVLTRSAYRWTKSAGGSNEYYLTNNVSRLQLAGGGVLLTTGGGGLQVVDGTTTTDPEIPTSPDFVTVDDQVAQRATPGALANGQWGYGDNDSLGFSTVYFRDDAGSPDDTGKTLRSILVPTCMATTGRRVLIGGSDGYLYVPTSDSYLDRGLHSTNPRISTAYIQTPFVWTNLEEVQLLAASRGGLAVSMSLYLNGRAAAPDYTWNMSIPMSDDLTLAEATAILADADFPVAPGTAEPWARLNINAHSFQLRASNIRMYGPAINLTGFQLRYRPLQP